MYCFILAYVDSQFMTLTVVSFSHNIKELENSYDSNGNVSKTLWFELEMVFSSEINMM